MRPLTSSPRIMFLSTGLSKGGAETQLVRLAGELRRSGWPTAIVSMDGTCHFKDILNLENIQFYPLGFRKSASPAIHLKALREANRITRDWQPDVLVSFMYHANLLGSLLSITSGRPSISSIRNENFGGPHREWIANLAARANTYVTINSSNAAATLVQRGVLPAERTIVIPNSIKVNARRDSSEFSSGAGMRWLALGRLYPQKDYPNLLRAFRKVADALPSSRLSIAGSGPLLPAIMELVSHLQLSSSVEVLGQRDDVDALLRSSDALVLSSAWEGMPNAVMESMANGLPVVATEVGGVSELVVDQETGFLCKPRDSNALAEAMLKLAGMTPLERFKMGEAGRQLTDRLYSIGAISDQWKAVLRESIGWRKRTPAIPEGS